MLALNKEGMFRRGLQFLPVNRQVDDDLIRVVDGVYDGVEADRVRFLIPRKNVVPDKFVMGNSSGWNGNKSRHERSSSES